MTLQTRQWGTEQGDGGPAGCQAELGQVRHDHHQGGVITSAHERAGHRHEHRDAVSGLWAQAGPQVVLVLVRPQSHEPWGRERRVAAVSAWLRAKATADSAAEGKSNSSSPSSPGSAAQHVAAHVR